MKEYYKQSEYEGFETNYRILHAIEALTNSDLIGPDGETDEKSQAYIWWTNGHNEDQIIAFLDKNYPDWRENKYLQWGDGMLKNDKLCAVCNEPLILDDGYWSCPVYMEGEEQNADEHTSIEGSRYVKVEDYEFSEEMDQCINKYPDWSAYFDDLWGHIQLLRDEFEILDECEKRDEIEERLSYLDCVFQEGDVWIDNDITSSPTAWKTLKTFNCRDAIEQYNLWKGE